MSSKPIQHGEKTYKSIRQLYNELAPPISYVTFTARLTKFGSVEMALAPPQPQPCDIKHHVDAGVAVPPDETMPENAIQKSRWRHQRGAAVSLWGNFYQSIAVVCQLFGVSHSVVYDYMAREQTQNLTAAIQYAMSLGIDVEDIHYPSLNAAAVAYRQDYTRLLVRIHNGWNLLDALKTPLTRDYSGNSITVFGKTYKSTREACTRERISICRLPKRKIQFNKYLEILIRVRELYITNDAFLPARVPYLVVGGEVFRTRTDVVRDLLTISEAHLKRKHLYGCGSIPDMIRYLSKSGLTKRDIEPVYAPLEYRRYLIDCYDAGNTDIESIPLPKNLFPYTEWFLQKNPQTQLHIVR